MLPGEFRASCEQIQPYIAAARNRISPQLAADLLQLQLRHESILLMPRGGGKTRIGQCSAFGRDLPIGETGGWLDEDGQDAATLTRLVTAMLKLHREQRATLPHYNPKITLRPETWDRIKSRLFWVEPHQVAQIEFPKAAFYSALVIEGACRDSIGAFPPAWLESCCDSSGRLLPGLAFDALERTVALAERSESYAKWRGYAEACADLVAAQTDVSYWLTFMAAGDSSIYMRGRRLSIPLERALLRIRQARRAKQGIKLPHGLTASGFVRYCEVAGIWRVTAKKYVEFSRPYAVGTSFLKARLTTAAFEDMLRE